MTNIKNTNLNNQKQYSYLIAKLTWKEKTEKKVKLVNKNSIFKNYNQAQINFTQTQQKQLPWLVFKRKKYRVKT